MTDVVRLNEYVANVQKPYVVRNQDGWCVDMMRFAKINADEFKAWVYATRRLRELRKAAA